MSPSPCTKGRRLSALIVNYESGPWALRCVESLIEEWERDGRERDDLEIVVVDSGSKPGEETWWRSLRRLGARVCSEKENVGYASGLNLAYQKTTGAADDVVALLNPDLYFLHGSLRPLLERLDQAAHVGAVAPRLFIDEERQLRLPPNELPTPWIELVEALSHYSPALARVFAGRRSAQTRRWWNAERTTTTEMLSGACVFMRREVVERLEVLMDTRYPLYFEDADLSRRLDHLGLSLEMVPEAEALHHWSRCAGPDFEGEVAERHAHSRTVWLGEHHDGFVDRSLLALASWVRSRCEGRTARPMHPLEELGVLNESPLIDFPDDGDYTVELSLTPFWGLSVGVQVEADSYCFPARTWSWLFPGTYYLRALDQAGRCLGAWSFEKRSPARSWPLDHSSFPSPRRSSAPTYLGERVG